MLDVLKQFFADFLIAYEKDGTKDVCLFLIIEDNSESEEDTKKVIEELVKDNTEGNEFIFPLPRLKKENWKVIDQWISTYLIGDQGCIHELLDKYFQPLLTMKDFTMYDAEKQIKSFLKKINSGDEEVIEILNA